MADARIFRDNGDIREEMKQGIMSRIVEGLGEALGEVYGMAQEMGVGGAIQDIQRRVVEQGWFGKDLYDGRMAWDAEAARGQEEVRDAAADFGSRAERQEGDRGQVRDDRDRGDDLGL